MAIADAAVDLDAPPPRELVEIERAVVIEHAEMHRILGRGGERLEMGAGDLDDVGLLLRAEAELEQLRPELIAEPRHERQIAPLDQRGRQPVRRRAGEVEPRRQLGQPDGPVDHRLDHVEPAEQRLAARCALPSGAGGSVFADSMFDGMCLIS